MSALEGYVEGMINFNGGGGGGTSDYEDLENKPSINGVTLSGNKTTSDLNVSYNDLQNKPYINNMPASTGADIGDVLTHTSDGDEWAAPATPLDVYSTNETRIGTWLNGKPLYRKCFSINVTLGASWTNLASVVDLNIEELVKTLPVGAFDISNGVNLIDINGMQIRHNGNYIQGYHLTNYSVTVKSLVIEYTKTTD
jgi:hypothetical protein